MNLSEAADTVLTREVLAKLRHGLRTPVQLMMGYSEMLLEDAVGPESARRRALLEEVLSAARDVLGSIQRALPATGAELRSDDVAALHTSLREPQARILRATAELLEPTGAPLDEPFISDVRKIHESAVELLPVQASAAPDHGSELGAVDRPARILVVDDLEDVRDVLERRLQRMGYAVECAENGRVALEKVAERPFDLVLLDIEMPELDGYGVLKRMKADLSTRDIPIIVISALDDLDSAARCIELGAEDHLPKPFEPVWLRARIGACLEKKRLRDKELEYLGQVNRVTDAAAAVETGSYDSASLTAVAKRGDELGRLARVFNTMAAEVRTREERLREQIRELRREIEQARRVSLPAAVKPPSLPEGQLFAERYEILEELGSGGMGMVYKARDRELDDDVAIKTLRRDLLQRDATMIERFKSEIRLARRISHRNIVRTHDFGEWKGLYYLTMEYVEGITVRELIDTRGQLGISSTLAIGTQLAQALNVAHEQGVIHRDVKPQNLLLDEYGVLKVMDFGIARLAEGAKPITAVGVVIGTPAYMAPEQLLDGDVDARSDLYAAGVVLYECLTGRLPFEAPSPVSLIAKQLESKPPPPATLNADVPPALSSLVVRLLSRYAADRLRTAEELAHQLAQIVE